MIHDNYNITKYQITRIVLLSLSLSKLKHTHARTHSNNTDNNTNNTNNNINRSNQKQSKTSLICSMG